MADQSTTPTVLLCRRTLSALPCSVLKRLESILVFKLIILFKLSEYSEFVGRISQSVWRLNLGWTVLNRIPVETRFSARPDRPWGPTSLL